MGVLCTQERGNRRARQNLPPQPRTPSKLSDIHLEPQKDPLPVSPEGSLGQETSTLPDGAR